MKFIHTADWQIGKPFAGIGDVHKRSLVQQARIEAINRIGRVAKDIGAEFVVVAGDLFDSPNADKATVSAACSAIGQMKLPVIAIPGNHDHGGPGCVWQQEFFLREQKALAPNFTVIRENVPVELDSAVILPSPLSRRAVATDPTEWLRNLDVYSGLPPDKPRVVLAHGSTQSFSGQIGDDDEDGYSTNLINLGRLPEPEIDYIALGDWHGTKQIGPKSWYAGTPEPDRFPRGTDYDSGNILVVEAQRGGVPNVNRVHLSKLNWSEWSFDFADDQALNEFEHRLEIQLGQRANEDLLKLTLTGSVGIEAAIRLEEILESLNARLLRLKLVNQILIAPTEKEIEDLTQRGTDPLIANVAKRLLEFADGGDEDALVARTALRELHAACNRNVPS